MSSILIVDDEELVRSLVIGTIDFQSLGFREVWEAEDGELAYNMVAEHHPDVLLTDIRMPFMDGLELAERVRREFPNTKIIILTGHDEFQYAKKAIQLGVTDYIVKPIKPDELSALLKKAADELETERRERLEQTKLKRQLRESLPLLRERALNAAIMGSAEGLVQKLQSLDLDLSEAEGFSACVFDFDPLPGAGDREAAIPLARAMIEAEAGKKGVVFSDVEQRMVLLLYGGQTREQIRTMVSALRVRVNGELKYSCACGVGAEVDSAEDIGTTYADALRSLDRMTDDRNKTYDSAALPMAKFDYPKQQVADLIAAIELNMPYEKALAALIAAVSGKDVPVDGLRLIYGDVTGAGKKVLLFAGAQIPEELSRPAKVRTVAELSERLSQELSATAQLLENIKIPRKRLIVENAKNYINGSFDDPDLNLNTVAAEVFVSPSYLSMLFKKETGESFVDYLTRVRMDAAKQIIRQNDLKSYEVALKVGYSDAHYFGVAFKKYTGMSPSEYKKLER